MAMPGTQHRVLSHLAAGLGAPLAIVEGCYLGGVGIAHEQDTPRAVACFVLAALALIVADMLRPGKPSYR
jgi:hypothetical protein